MQESDFKLFSYNAKDLYWTWIVAKSLSNCLHFIGLEGPNEFQQSMAPLVLRAMNRGVRIDLARKNELAMELQIELANREQWFLDVLGHPLNPKSPKQMKLLFYNDLKAPLIKDRASGNATLDDEALVEIADRAPLLKPLIQKIQEYRSLGVFFSTFVMAKLDTDNRMRCSYNIGGTDTYRLSSKRNPFGCGMNMQNIPKGGEEADGLELPNIRELFIPDEGYTFFDPDLSKADLRVVVWESDEQEMKAMLREGADPYVMIAREYYKDPSIKKTREDGSINPKYDTFKRFAHGTHYLASARGLSWKLGLSIKEVEATQKWYFEKFPAIPRWQKRIKEEIEGCHYITNVFGYRRYFLDRIDERAYRQGINWIPQSTIGLLINKGWMNIHNNLPKVEVLIQVHDSLPGQYPTHLGDWVKQRIKEEMSIEIPYEDPLTIPVDIKTSIKSWGHCS